MRTRKTMRRTVCAAGLFAVLAGSVAAQAQSTSLRVGMAASDQGVLDPHRATATPDVAVLYWMFDGLVRIRPGQANPEFIEPDLAESWETSDDGLTWRFHLRDGVPCQGGYGELTADDVVFSLHRAADKETSSFFADYAAFDKIEAVDPRTVEITLKNTVPSLLGLLVPYHGGNIVCQAAVQKLGEDYSKRPVGTGPYEFVEYQPQQFLRLKANESYWRGAPRIKEIIYRYIPSDSSRDLAFQSGELDMIYGRSDDTWYDRMQQLPGIKVNLIGPGELYNVHLNMTEPPLDDLKVRQAIAHAVNREQLARFKGEKVTIPAGSVVPHDYLGHADVDLLAPDLEEAKRLLAESGHEDGITLKVIQTTLPGMLTTMQAVQAQLKRANINLDLITVEHATFHAQIRQDLSQVVLYAAARFPVADVYLTQFFDSHSIVGTPTAITNFSHCAVADEEIEKARTETDLEEQKKLWKTAQQKIVDEVCAIPIYELPQVWAWHENLDLGYEIEGSLNLAPPITEKAHFTR